MPTPTTVTATRIVDAIRSDPGNGDLRNEAISLVNELLAATEAAQKYLSENRPVGKIRDIFPQLNQYENGVMKPLRSALDKARKYA